MFEPNLSIDVSLLAIILGLYATKNDRNLILLLLCFLFAHVLLTNDDDDDGDDHGNNDNNVDDNDVDDDDDDSSLSDSNVFGDALGAAVEKKPSVIDHFSTTVSSGVFDRQLNTPQTNLTSTVFPATSLEANGKLASARSSFFDSLVS